MLHYDNDDLYQVIFSIVHNLLAVNTAAEAETSTYNNFQAGSDEIMFNLSKF